MVCPDDLSTEEAETAETFPSDEGRDKLVVRGCIDALLDVEECADDK